MNNTLTVRDTTDAAAYIAIQYRVVEIFARVAAVTGASDVSCVLEVVRPGWNTEGDYDNWVAYRETTGMLGTMGAIKTQTLNNLEVYSPLKHSYGYGAKY
jgi:hypothetical protein